MLTRQSPEPTYCEIVWNGSADYYGTGERGQLLPDGDDMRRQPDPMLNRVKMATWGLHQTVRAAARG